MLGNGNHKKGQKKKKRKRKVAGVNHALICVWLETSLSASMQLPLNYHRTHFGSAINCYGGNRSNDHAWCAITLLKDREYSLSPVESLVFATNSRVFNHFGQGPRVLSHTET